MANLPQMDPTAALWDVDRSLINVCAPLGADLISAPLQVSHEPDGLTTGFVDDAGRYIPELTWHVIEVARLERAGVVLIATTGELVIMRAADFDAQLEGAR